MTDASVKCIVWDLDDTVWDGILLEDGNVELRQEVARTIRTLDERGILHSIASRNDHTAAMAKLEEFGMAEYFLHPQIHWGKKSESVRAIAGELNIGIDTVAFVDDQPFERDEVGFCHPEVLTIDAAEAHRLADSPRMHPRFVTVDSRKRRHLYQADAERRKAEERYEGTSEDFLASLRMRMTVEPAQEEDLQRAEELTVRTNQLNATGYTYSYEELDAFRTSGRHDLLVAGLDDTYGAYGRIGLCLVEHDEREWTLKLLLMSCRVMSRGVGSVLLNHVVRRARDAGVRLLAEFVPTDRNRAMYVTYKFAGFREAGQRGDVVLMENDYSNIHEPPAYLEFVSNDRHPRT